MHPFLQALTSPCTAAVAATAQSPLISPDFPACLNRILCEATDYRDRKPVSLGLPADFCGRGLKNQFAGTRQAGRAAVCCRSYR